jgi:hypothetical protein
LGELRIYQVRKSREDVAVCKNHYKNRPMGIPSKEKFEFASLGALDFQNGKQSIPSTRNESYS